MDNISDFERSFRQVFKPIGIKQKELSKSDMEAIEADFNNPDIVEENDMPVFSYEECMEAHRLTLSRQGEVPREVWEHG